VPEVLHAITPYGRDAGSSRVRVYAWLDRIAEPAVVSGYLGERDARPGRLIRRPGAVLAAERRLRRMAAARPERLLLHREASPLSRGGLEARLARDAGFAVYDFDDALQWDTGAGGRLRRLAPKAPKALAAVRAADRVVAGNAVLADWAAQHNADVVVIPSCVAVDAYAPKARYELADPPRIGWIGNADNEAYLAAIGSALEQVHERTGARLTIVGAPARGLGRLEAMIDRIAWSEAAQHTALASFDIGVAPVPDAPYERGKCGYKLLQYGAAGLPFVASPVGVNRDILRAFGLAAVEAGEDWAAAIAALLERPAAERAALGRAIRAITQRSYSFDAWLPRWRQAVGLAP
jgi:glycosyltransferase involved in cell wall biosynthesis